MLTTAYRDRLRVQLLRVMPTPVEIQREQTIRDPEGDYTTVWLPLERTIGRIGNGDQRVAQEIVVGQQLQGVMLWTIALPGGTEFDNQDRIIGLGVTYQVVGVLAPQSYETERRAICVVVEPA